MNRGAGSAPCTRDTTAPNTPVISREASHADGYGAAHMDIAALPRPDVILTHESDLDGFVAGHLLVRLARNLFETDVPLEAWNNQGWRQRPMRERAAWICDLAFEERVDRPDWVIIDHHVVPGAPVNARLIHNPAKCAARLCYELCQARGLGSSNLDRLVELTEVGDLFLEAHPDFTLANDYASLLKAYPFWNLSRLLDGNLDRLLDHPLLEVTQVRRRVEDPIGLAWSRERVVEVTPQLGFVDVVVGNGNLIVHELLAAPECRHPVLMTLLKKGAAGVVASFRSRDGQAIEVARRLQGGGHPNASGATLPRSVQSIPDALTYLRRVLNPTRAVAAALVEDPGGLRWDA
ncbi:MAG: DHH family phosphoesterase [Verrucomicrobiae bacterium]|nr:DHH family phosphoesterase [Verrucomicrobiae bacterium]